jgi:alkanesulfonate monooxygenase SsuD/methylene tetrahydromethanopterin reductase-like flavin-dependent oxidoreductase (luciferase family)
LTELAFGIFDHLDRGPLPVGEFYRARLRIAEAYDRAGFYSYHLAEHHATPLGMAPSPGIFLSALAQHTERLRFGPLVYLLPLYHPIRLVEEIAMLDQLSGGRIDVGVGRGISPFESMSYGAEPEHSQAIFEEALEIVRQGLRTGKVTHEGRFFTYRDHEFEVRPVQQPQPPFWYGISSPSSAERCAQAGMNVVTLSKDARVAELIRAFKAEAGRLGHDGLRAGVGRFIVVGKTDADALAVARRAYPVWARNFHYLYHKNHTSPVQGERPKDFDGAVVEELGFAGSPASVRDYLTALLQATGANYLMCQFVFGDMTLAESLSSIELFTTEVMPALRAIPATA